MQPDIYYFHQACTISTFLECIHCLMVFSRSIDFYEDGFNFYIPCLYLIWKRKQGGKVKPGFSSLRRSGMLKWKN